MTESIGTCNPQQKDIKDEHESIVDKKTYMFTNKPTRLEIDFVNTKNQTERKLKLCWSVSEYKLILRA